MNAVRMLRGRGPEGLPKPEPLDFPALVPPPSPNFYLAAPAGHAGRAHRILPPFPVAPDALWDTLARVAAGFERTWPLASWPELRQAQWVARTRWANFPDIIAAQVVPRPGGAGLYLCSRSLFGWYDFGVNRRRVEAWLAALDAALRRG